MATIEDIIKGIKEPTRVIDINWIKDIQLKNYENLSYQDLIKEIINEYILTREISHNIYEYLESFLKHIKAKGEKKIKKLTNFFLRGEYGTGKSHFLMFLSLLLIDDPTILTFFKEKSKNVEYLHILKLSEEIRSIIKNEFLICPIKLTDFDSDIKLAEIIRFNLQEIASKKLNDTNIRIFSIYDTLEWFKEKLSPEIRDLILDDLDRNTRGYINKELNELKELEFEELIEIQNNLINVYEEKTGTKYSTKMEHKRLTEVLKNSLLFKKHEIKHYIIILDELSQWWGNKSEQDLINQLHGLVEDFNSELDLNTSLITSYQKYFKTDMYLTLKDGRLKNEWVLQTSEFKDIVPKRCLNQESLDHDEIERIGLAITNRIINTLKISENTLKKYFFFDDNIAFDDNREGVKEYIELFYPFHPIVFIPEIWREIGKFSTEMRGGMNIVVRLLNTNLYNDSNNLIKPGEMISEILNDIFDRDSNLENFYRKVKSTLNLDDNSIELNIIKLLFVFRDGLSIEEFNLFFLQDISEIIENFYNNLISNDIIQFTYESKSNNYLISFETVVNIDTYFNRIEKLINNRNILNYLHYHLKQGQNCEEFIDDYGNLTQTFYCLFLKNFFLNLDDFEAIKNLIQGELEETNLLISEKNDEIINIDRNFIETSIPDGFIYYFIPKLKDVKQFIEMNFKNNDKVIFAYSDKNLKDIEYMNFNLYQILQLNLILDILKRVSLKSGDLLETSSTLFDDVFNDFNKLFQDDYGIEFEDLDGLSNELQSFTELCSRSAAKITTELAERSHNIPSINEDFFKAFKGLYKYIYYGREYNNYFDVRTAIMNEIFPLRLDMDDNFFNSTRINHLLECLKDYDVYKPPKKPPQETLTYYSKIGLLKALKGDKFKVGINFNNTHLTPIQNFIIDELNDDPIPIEEILVKLRHSEYGLHFEYTLISIVALYNEGFIKLKKLKNSDLKDFPLNKEKDTFLNKISKLNNLSKKEYYIQKGDLVNLDNWKKIINFLKFLKESLLFPDLKAVDIKYFQGAHNVNSERSILEIINQLRLTKIQLIEKSIENFISSVDFEDEIVEGFEFKMKLEGIKNFANLLKQADNINKVLEILEVYISDDFINLKDWLPFFDDNQKYQEIIKIFKKLKQVIEG